MHGRCQVGYPGWSSIYDTDPAAANARLAFVERFADTGTLVKGNHPFRLVPAG
jgi:hypothetical protein